MTDNRHPAGTSIGGRWAPGSAAEIDEGAIGAADNEWIVLDDDETYELEGDDVINSIEVSRLGDEMFVHANVNEHFRDAIPEESGRYFDDEGKTQYINEREHVIAQFLEDNYSSSGVAAELRGGDEVTGVQFTTGIRSDHGAVAESEVHDVACATGAPRFYNEMDPGTYGSANMQRQLSDALAEYDSKPLPAVDVAAEDREDFIRGFTTTMAEDHQERFNDENTGSDVEVDLKDQGFKKRVEDEAAKFLDEHSGDLDYLAKAPRSGQNWRSLGGDAYLQAANVGASYSDRQSAQSPEIIVAERLSSSTSSHFDGRRSTVDFEGSVSVDEDGSIIQ